MPLPEELGRRDGSGVRLVHAIAAIGGALGADGGEEAAATEGGLATTGDTGGEEPSQ